MTIRIELRKQLELAIARLNTAMKYGADMETSLLVASEDALKVLEAAVTNYKKENDVLFKVYTTYSRCFVESNGNAAYAIDETCALIECPVDFVLESIRRYGHAPILLSKT